MSHIVNRISDFAHSQRISIRKIEIKIGAGNGTLSKAIGNEKDIHTKWIASFLENYPEVSAEWLLRGVGSMIKADSGDGQVLDQVEEPRADYPDRLLDQKEAVIESLHQVIRAQEGQLKDKERLMAMKDRIIEELEERFGK